MFLDSFFLFCVCADGQINVEEGMQMSRSQWQLFAQNVLGKIAGIQRHWWCSDETVMILVKVFFLFSSCLPIHSWCLTSNYRYREAKAVVAKESRSGNNSKPRKSLTLQLRRKPRNKLRISELVFLQPSPNYCEADPTTGSLGVVGRRCNRTSAGMTTKRAMKVDTALPFLFVGFASRRCWWL